MCRVCRSDVGIVLNARSVEYAVCRSDVGSCRYAEFVDLTWA